MHAVSALSSIPSSLILVGHGRLSSVQPSYHSGRVLSDGQGPNFNGFLLDVLSPLSSLLQIISFFFSTLVAELFPLSPPPFTEHGTSIEPGPLLDPFRPATCWL